MPINAKRLLKLAAFLDKLPKSHFDFLCVQVRKEKTKELTCGTVGCAIGWCPVVFRGKVRVAKISSHVYGWLSNDRHQGCRLVSRMSAYGKLFNMFGGGHGDLADHMFSLPSGHGFRLFTHEEESPANGSYLPESATPKQVAKRIRTYVKWAQKKGI